MWIKKRHRIVFFILQPVFYVLIRIMYGFSGSLMRLEKDRPYVILSNHQTSFDQFMLAASFSRPIYYVASDDIFSLGFVSSVISFLVAPIPKSKAARDSQTIRDCLQIVRENGVIAIFPEGNRTYSGCTEHIDPVIARFVKKLGATLILFKIEGGYGVEPRWTAKRRKGKMSGSIAQIISPEQLAKIPSEDLFQIISNAFDVCKSPFRGRYRSAARAEYVERLLYVCPHCSQIRTFRSDGNLFFCSFCGLRIEYSDTMELIVQNGECPFTDLKQWYDYQEDYVRKLNLSPIPIDTPLFFDDNVCITENIRCRRKQKMFTGQLSLSQNLLSLKKSQQEQVSFFMYDIDEIAILGRNKINLRVGSRVFQLKGEPRFNAVKYVHFYHKIKKLGRQKTNEFLGL